MQKILILLFLAPVLFACSVRHTPVKARFISKREAIKSTGWFYYEYVSADSTHLQFLTKKNMHHKPGRYYAVLPCQAKRIWKP